MTIDEAIKEMQDEVDEHLACGDLPYYKALKKGIGALRREKAWRENPRWGIPPLMPGETEE